MKTTIARMFTTWTRETQTETVLAIIVITARWSTTLIRYQPDFILSELLKMHVKAKIKPESKKGDSRLSVRVGNYFISLALLIYLWNKYNTWPLSEGTLFAFLKTRDRI